MDSFVEAWVEWEATETDTPKSTRARYRRVPRFAAEHGIARISDVTRETLAAYQNGRRKQGRSAKTVNVEVGAIIRVMRFVGRTDSAVALRIAQLALDDKSIFLGLPPAKPPTYYTRAEFDRLRDGALKVGKWLWLALTLDCYTGLRRGELLRLEREDIDLTARVIRVHRRFDMGEAGETKTRQERVVPICSALIVEIEKRLPESGPIFPALASSSRSRYVCSERAKRALKELARWTGIAATWPKCRRTFVTWCLRATPAVPLTDLARWLGHSDIGMLHRYYYAWIQGYSASIERLT